MIVDTLRIHSNNLNKKHYLLHEVIEFVGRIERLLVGQYQRFDHMQCPFACTSENVPKRYVSRKPRGSHRFRESLPYRFSFSPTAYIVRHPVRCAEISPTSVAYFIYFVKILRVNLYFRQPYDAIERSSAL